MTTGRAPLRPFVRADSSRGHSLTDLVQSDRAPRGPAVLGDIGQGLGDHKICGRLHGRVRPATERVEVELSGDARPSHQWQGAPQQEAGRRADGEPLGGRCQPQAQRDVRLRAAQVQGLRSQRPHDRWVAAQLVGSPGHADPPPQRGHHEGDQRDREGHQRVRYVEPQPRVGPGGGSFRSPPLARVVRPPGERTDLGDPPPFQVGEPPRRCQDAGCKP